MTEEQIKRVARTLSDWLQSAMYDLAAGQCAMAGARCDAYGEYSAAEAAAEKLYDDPATLRDLLGDRIHDEGRGDYATMILIATEIKRTAHKALKKACDAMIKDWTRYSN